MEVGRVKVRSRSRGRLGLELEYNSSKIQHCMTTTCMNVSETIDDLSIYPLSVHTAIHESMTPCLKGKPTSARTKLTCCPGRCLRQCPSSAIAPFLVPIYHAIVVIVVVGV